MVTFIIIEMLEDFLDDRLSFYETYCFSLGISKYRISPRYLKQINYL